LKTVKYVHLNTLKTAISIWGVQLCS